MARNATYIKHLSTLSHLVLVLFAKDITVVPKESSWFGSYAPPADSNANEPHSDCVSMEAREEDKTIIPMRAHPLYTEDWIGLRALDERGAVVLASCEGEHMQLSKDCWEPLVKEYVGELLD